MLSIGDIESREGGAGVEVWVCGCGLGFRADRIRSMIARCLFALLLSSRAQPSSAFILEQVVVEMAMASNTCRAVSVAFVIIVVLSVAVRGAPTKLQAYNVALTNTSVSGLSSGGFFAVQLHVAFSSFIRGAGTY